MNEESMEPKACVVGPIVYHVPSMWEFAESDAESDFYVHGEDWVQVTRLIMLPGEDASPGPEDPCSLLGHIKEDAEDHGPAVRLSSGFAMVSYTASVAGDPGSVELHCELCGFAPDGTLAVVRYSTSTRRARATEPDAIYWTHIFRQMARGTRFVE